MVHKLLQYMREVDKTHKGLGRLFSFSLMATKARKAVIVIGLAGTGKSTAMKAAVKLNREGQISKQSMTRSGLVNMQKELTGFEGVLMVEDLANVDTIYSVKESIKCAVSLVYEHTLSKLNASVNLEITDYFGSFISSIQPIKMQEIVGSSDWEAVMRDKTIRYYHFIRVIKPNPEPIDINADWGIDFDKVVYKEPHTQKFKELFRVGLDQWGISRTKEHIKDMLKACAALDGRKFVNASDVKVCLELTRPMRVEHHLIHKLGFESDKEFLSNHACMLTEFATYGKVTHALLASNYFVSMRTIQRILLTVKELYTPDPKDEKLLYPSVECRTILEESGYM